MNASDAHRLEDAGFSCGPNGDAMLSGPAAALFQGWIRGLKRTLEPFYTTVYQGSPLIDAGVLDRVQYAEHFPQNLIRCRSHQGNGMDGKCLTPAACFHLYPTLVEDGPGPDGFAAFITAPCARFEEGCWNPPYRLSAFHMTELVVVGAGAQVDATRRAVQDRIERLFTDLGADGAFETALDAFFMGSGRGARLLQQLKELKKEYRVPAGPGTVALASVNDHEAFFGRAFGVHLASGEPASSFCAAFGLERLTAWGLLRWGAAPERWPEVLQA